MVPKVTSSLQAQKLGSGLSYRNLCCLHPICRCLEEGSSVPPSHILVKGQFNRNESVATQDHKDK